MRIWLTKFVVISMCVAAFGLLSLTKASSQGLINNSDKTTAPPEAVTTTEDPQKAYQDAYKKAYDKAKADTAKACSGGGPEAESSGGSCG